MRKGPDMPPAQPVADSEPVIVVGDDGGDALSYRRLIQSFEPGTKLYLHAQPAPVVPTFDEWLEIRGSKPLGWVKDAMRESYDACRSAMLQESQKSAGASNNCRSSENVQVVQDVSRCSTKAAPALDSPPKTAESRGGNSPVIPDGSEWTNEQCLEFLTVAFRHNEISGDIEFDDIRLGVKFALSAAPQEVNHG
ncbi:TPA: hypothetical protein ACQZJD_005160 [Raoultella ornithinolytica]